jgi:hypothetical protein
VIVKDGKKYWEFIGEVKEILSHEEREIGIKKLHEELNHRGSKGNCGMLFYNVPHLFLTPRDGRE